MLAQGGELLLQLVIMIVFGAICASIANGRGRSPVAWFLIGLVAPCIGLILVLVLPNLKVEQERQQRMRNENRRLREKIRKDRMVADQRHNATQERLGVHDEALGVDTSKAVGAGALPPAPKHLDDGTEWYYLKGKKRVGPFTLDQMRRLWADRRIGSETSVWAESMEDWAELSTVEKLRSALDA